MAALLHLVFQHPRLEPGLIARQRLGRIMRLRPPTLAKEVVRMMRQHQQWAARLLHRVLGHMVIRMMVLPGTRKERPVLDILVTHVYEYNPFQSKRRFTYIMSQPFLISVSGLSGTIFLYQCIITINQFIYT